MTDLGVVARILVIPTVLMFLGGLVAFFRELGPKTISGMQHAASGVLIGAVSFELCGSLVAHSALEKGVIFIGFFCGVAFLMFLGRFEFLRLVTKCYGKNAGEPKIQHLPMRDDTEMGMLKRGDTSNSTELPSALSSPSLDATLDATLDASVDATGEATGEATGDIKDAPVPMGLIAGVFLDGTIDGLLIGLNFSINLKAGLLTALALSFEMCLLGLSTVVTLKTTVLPRWGVFVLNAVFPLPIMGAGMIAAALLNGLTGAPFQFIIAFGIGALLFLVAEELLIKAHEEENTDTWYVTSLFYAGFIFVLAMEVLSE